MEENIVSIVERKRWTAEEKLREARDLAEKAIKLLEGAKENIPRFLGTGLKKG